MALGKRERILAWAVGGVIGLYLADTLVLNPYLADAKALTDMRLKEKEDAETVRLLKYKEKSLRPRVDALPTDPKDAERQLLGAITDWATQTGVTMSSVKPEYVDSKNQMREIMVQASGSGRNEAMVKFIVKLQHAKFPLKVVKMQLGTRNNDSEDLTMQLRVSTLYKAPEQKNEPAKKDNGKKIADAH